MLKHIDFLRYEKKLGLLLVVLKHYFSKDRYVLNVLMISN